VLFLITGASGSGKSAYAEALACHLARRDKVQHKIYLATMKRDGMEARARIARHRALRAGKGFVTLEAPFGFPVPGKEGEALVLLECVSNLLANLLFDKRVPAGEAAGEILFQVRRAACCHRHIVVVTNEIFSDGGAYREETLAYVRALGESNRLLAAEADVFCEVVYGVPMFIKGEEQCLF